LFRPDEREALRAELVASARTDRRIVAAAVTGSAARDALDRWSDIDLYFGVPAPADVAPALAAWTTRMREAYGAVDHFDRPSGPAVYRVFLLPSTLQVDLAFVPADHFGPRGAAFRTLFGEAGSAFAPPAPRGMHDTAALGWLYALHARACLGAAGSGAPSTW
jgi:hypothetical protein